MPVMRPESQTEIIEEHTGSSTLLRTQIPKCIEDWNLTHRNYVRVSVGDDQEGPKIAIWKSGATSVREATRSNDLAMPSSKHLPLPRRLIRALGVEEGIQWIDMGEQLIGRFKSYNNSSTLYDVAVFYYEGEQDVPNESDDDNFETTFHALRQISDDECLYTSGEGLELTVTPGKKMIHQLPKSFPNVVDKTFAFVLFHDGDSFVVGLLPMSKDSVGREQQNMYSGNTFSYSPYNTYDEPPIAVLNYEKDSVVVQEDDATGRQFYTVPKQVASVLWLDDGFTSDWVRINNAFFTRITPESRSKNRSRVDVNETPRNLWWD